MKPDQWTQAPCDSGGCVQVLWKTSSYSSGSDCVQVAVRRGKATK